MSFKADGPKSRPERVKPPPPPDALPTPPAWSTSRRSSTSSIASFHSAQSGRFSPTSETRMLSASQELKSQANILFTRQDYSSAIGTYDRASAELPRYLDYEMAVLQSNLAACHLKLEQWKETVESCDRGLEGLEREMPTKRKQTKQEKAKNGKKEVKKETRQNHTGRRQNGKLNSDTESEDEAASPPSPPADASNDAVVELPSDDEDGAKALAALNISDERKADITRIRVKLLLRRARARSSMPPSSTFSDPAPKPPSSAKDASGTGSTWSTLSAALEDYTLLHSTPSYWTCLPTSDRKTVSQALIALPPKIDEAKQKEVSDMMGKLKDLGNTVLKPFGLSTDMFKVQQGEGGGYSLSFDQGKKG